MYIKGHPRLRDMHDRETRNPIDNNYYVCTRIYKQKVAHHTSFSILCLNGSHFATPEMNSVNDTSRKINIIMAAPAAYICSTGSDHAFYMQGNSKYFQAMGATY